MKALKIIIIIFLIVLVVFGAGFFAFKSYTTATGSFTQDEKLDPVNGDSNPTDGFCNIGFKDGKLYYEFLPSDLPGFELRKAGIYVIDENVPQFIGDDIFLSDVVPSKASSDEEDEFDVIANIKDMYDHNKNPDDEMDWERLYTVTDDYIIYLSKDLYIKKLDRKTLKCLYKTKLKDNVIDFYNIFNYDFIIGGDKLFLEGQLSSANNPDVSDSVVVYDVTKGFKKIFEKNVGSLESYGFKCYKDKLFLYSTDSGIYSLNTNTGKNKNLTNQGITEIYIFGDKWVYFVNNSRCLYRVSQDGAAEETLFKIGWW